jgi:hypothetical protein
VSCGRGSLELSRVKPRPVVESFLEFFLDYFLLCGFPASMINYFLAGKSMMNFLNSLLGRQT